MNSAASLRLMADLKAISQVRSFGPHLCFVGETVSQSVTC